MKEEVASKYLSPIMMQKILVGENSYYLFYLLVCCENGLDNVNPHKIREYPRKSILICFERGQRKSTTSILLLLSSLLVSDFPTMLWHNDSNSVFGFLALPVI